MKTVYLCGTVTPDPKHLQWRDQVVERFAETNIMPLSPVRGKDPKNWTKDGLEGVGDVPYSDGGFVPRDMYDVRRADALLVYFMEAPERQSLGTWIEFGWADAWGKPIVVCSTLNEVIKHPFIYKRACRVVSDLESACDYLEFLLME